MRKLPPYFLKADPEAPCQKCDKVRGTCKFCECCYDCCECCPRFICPYCHGRDTTVQEGSDMAKELELCECEPCKGGCGKIMMDRDQANYMLGPDGFVLPEPWCDKCFKRVNKNETDH